jgi:hypothetical protein
MTRIARLSLVILAIALAGEFRPHAARAGGMPIQTLLNTDVHMAAVYESDYERLEAFLVSDDGAVHVVGKHHDSPWWPSATITGPNLAPPGAALAAVFEPPHWTEVFYVGNEGAVWELLKIDDGSWRAPKRMSPTNFAPAGSSLTAVWQGPHNRVDVFIVDSGGSLRRITRTGSGDFDMPPPISGNDFGKEGSPLTSVFYPDLDQTQVFEVGRDGTVLQDWRAGDGDWKVEHLSQPNFAPAFAPISAVYYPNPHDGHVEVFVIGNDGVLRGLWQSTTSNGWKADITLSPPDWFSTRAPVSAVYQPRDLHLEVFAFGKDGTMWDAWKGSDQNWHQAFPLPGPNFGRDLAPLAAVAQDVNEHLEVVGADANAALHASWKAHNGDWNPPALMTGQFLSPVIRPARCTRVLRSFSQGNPVDPGEENVCEWVMGIGEHCDSQGQLVSWRNPKSTSDVAINAPPYYAVCVDRFHSDSILEQAEHIITGVEQGLETAAAAVMSYAPEIAQGAACVGGQVYACVTLAISIAHRLGVDVPGAVGDVLKTAVRAVSCADGDLTSCVQLTTVVPGIPPEAIQTAIQAEMCTDGDIAACAQLGLRGASAAGVTVPGFDAAQVSDDVQKCTNQNSSDSFSACARLGLKAADAVGIPAVNVGSGIVNAGDCLDGNDQACLALGQRAAKVVGSPISGVLQASDNAKKCSNGETSACIALGQAVVKAAGVPTSGAQQAIDNAQKCSNGETAACLALGQAAAKGAGIPIGGVPLALGNAQNCANGDTAACMTLGRSLVGSAVPNGIENAQKCLKQDDTACVALARAIAGTGFIKDKDADQALRCAHGVQGDCLALGKAYAALAGLNAPTNLPGNVPMVPQLPPGP